MTFPPGSAHGKAASERVDAWVTGMISGSPNCGPLRGLELVLHWDGLSAEKRHMLLLLARELNKEERTEAYGDPGKV
jgi:hypothetical protein